MDQKEMNNQIRLDIKIQRKKIVQKPKSVTMSCPAQNVAGTSVADCLTNLAVEKKTDNGLNSTSKNKKVKKTSSESNLKVKNLLGKDSIYNAVENMQSARNCGECSKNIKDLKTNLSWDIKEFCNQFCLEKYQKRKNSNCTFCKVKIIFPSLGKYCVRLGYEMRQFCGNPCLQKYKKTFKVCFYCQKDISNKNGECLALTSKNNRFKYFCTELCRKKYDTMHAKEPQTQYIGKCFVCDIKSYIEVEFEHENQTKLFCSHSCFSAFKFVSDMVTGTCNLCLKEFDTRILQINSIYYENAHHFFCSTSCQNVFIAVSRKIVSCERCSISKYNFDMIKCKIEDKEVVVCSLHCLHVYRQPFNEAGSSTVTIQCKNCKKDMEILGNVQIDIMLPTFCSYTCLFAFANQEVPTDASTEKKKDIESSLSVPTQRNVATMCTVTAHSKSISCKPSTTDKAVQTDNLPNNIAIPIPVPIYVPFPVCRFSLPIPVVCPFPLPIPVPVFIATNSTTVSGILKEIQDIQENTPKDPLEAELIMMAEMVADNSQTILSSLPEIEESPKLQEGVSKALLEAVEDLESLLSPSMTSTTSSKKSVGSKRSGDSPNCPKKKRKQDEEMEGSESEEEDEKKDDQTSLKYMLGIDAWNQWMTLKKITSPLKTEILQLTVEELNFGLCLFIKEIRKPNQMEYSPDTIYYLCLCIQTYLSKNGRADNIFYDTYYENFAKCLDELALKFSAIYNDSDYIVTRVREEHLWESQQLGSLGPYVLLNTMLFFNTKYFKFGTIDEHKKLSFLKAQRHWRREFKQSGSQKSINSSSHKKTLGDIEKYLMDPLKLYEFYLSRCPDSAKNSTDMFYLVPERHCAPESPVWYSTTSLSHNELERMFHRIKLVKEINVALLYN